MNLYQVIMKAGHRISKIKLEELACSYLSALYKNGQIVDQNWSFAWQKGDLCYYVNTPRPDSYEEKYHSKYVQRDFEKLVVGLGRRPEWISLEDPATARYPSLKSSSFLFLYSLADEWESPVMRGNDGKEIPLYLLPIDADEREHLVYWHRNSGACWNLWMESGALEIPAWRQLSDPKSQHAKDGRRLCQVIETATGIPTYYYLDRYYTHATEIETHRPCPLCGKPWRIEKQWPARSKRWDFEFKCDPCRLVSQAGVSSGGEEEESLARIGDYRERKPRK